MNQKFTFWDLLIILLSVYVLVVMLVDLIIKVPPEISILLTAIDNTICLFFLADFSIRLFRAENKLKFLRWGWLDFISSIPAVDFLRFGRLFRLVRLLRVLRAFRSTRYLLKYLFKSKAQGTLNTVIIVSVLMVIFSSIAILTVETDPNSNIKTASDAIWWSCVTLLTVGYGDKYPITDAGRVIAILLMVVGVGLFSTFTGYFATIFIGSNNKDSD